MVSVCNLTSSRDIAIAACWHQPFANLEADLKFIRFSKLQLYLFDGLRAFNSFSVRDLGISLTTVKISF